MPESARKTDAHTCPSFTGNTPHEGGPISSPCSPNVDVEDQPASRGSKEKTCDFALCKTGEPDFIAQGSGTVLINDMHATRVGDMTEHAGVITGHASNVEIGGPTVTFRKIEKKGPAKKSDRKNQKSEGKTGDADAGKQSKQAGTKEPGKESPVGASKNGNVFARFRLVSPPNPKVGDELVFECTSWDPDTGGTSDSPNPERIVSRTWRLEGEGIASETADTGRMPRWIVRARSSATQAPNATASEPIAVQVIHQVADEQSHTAETSLSVKLSPVDQIIPKAVITLLPSAVEQIRSADSSPTKRMLRCDSYDDRQSASREPTPTTILARTWSATDSLGRSLPVERLDEDGRLAAVDPAMDSARTEQTADAGRVLVRLHIKTASGDDADEVEVTTDRADYDLAVVAAREWTWFYSLRNEWRRENWWAVNFQARITFDVRLEKGTKSPPCQLYLLFRQGSRVLVLDRKEIEPLSQGSLTSITFEIPCFPMSETRFSGWGELVGELRDGTNAKLADQSLSNNAKSVEVCLADPVPSHVRMDSFPHDGSKFGANGKLQAWIKAYQWAEQHNLEGATAVLEEIINLCNSIADFAENLVFRQKIERLLKTKVFATSVDQETRSWRDNQVKARDCFRVHYQLIETDSEVFIDRQGTPTFGEPNPDLFYLWSDTNYVSNWHSLY